MADGAQGTRHDGDYATRAEAKIGAEHKTLANCTASLAKAVEYQAGVVKAAKDHVAHCKAEQAASADRFQLVTAEHDDAAVKAITDAFDARKAAREDIARQIRDLQNL